jgi:class 3 adenylate cyclase
LPWDFINLKNISMEKTLAILMADLSGYTALTEAHGAISAADLIDRFLQIVKQSLVGSSRLHQRRGDEVMIVSESPDQEYQPRK